MNKKMEYENAKWEGEKIRLKIARLERLAVEADTEEEFETITNEIFLLRRERDEIDCKTNKLWYEISAESLQPCIREDTDI